MQRERAAARRAHDLHESLVAGGRFPCRRARVFDGMLDIFDAHGGQVADRPRRQRRHEGGAAFGRQHDCGLPARQRERVGGARVAFVEMAAQFVAQAAREGRRRPGGVHRKGQPPDAVRCGGREIAAAPLARIVDRHAAAARRRDHACVDRVVVGRSERQGRAGKVTGREGALDQFDRSRLRKRAKTGCDARRDDGDARAGLQNPTEFPFGDPAAAHDHDRAVEQVERDGIGRHIARGLFHRTTPIRFRAISAPRGRLCAVLPTGGA